MTALFNPVSSLFERYRPADLDSLLGQDKCVRQLRSLKSRYGTLGGRAYWISGKSGTGKTTLARIIAGDVASPFGIEEIDAAELTAAEISRQCQVQGQTIIGEKNGRALIVNEAHGFRADQVRRLLTMLEPDDGLPSHCVYVFTTTKAGQAKLFDDLDDAGPLLSRCVRLALEERGLNQVFADRLGEIARAEGLGDPTPQQCLKLVNEARGNFRDVLNALDGGCFL